MSLHASELNPVIETTWSAAATLVCNCKRTGKISNIFCFVPDVQPYGNYTEIFMHNVVKKTTLRSAGI